MTGDRVLTDDDYERMELEAEDERDAAEHYGNVMAHAEQQAFPALQARLDAGLPLTESELVRYARLKSLGHPLPPVPNLYSR